MSDLILWFSEINKDKIKIAGEKAVNLSIAYNLKILIPPSFIITANSCKHFLENAGIHNNENILSKEFPNELKEVILEAYENLNVDREVTKALGSEVLNSMIKSGRQLPYVSIRSSSSDNEAILSVKGKEELLHNIKLLLISNLESLNEQSLIIQKMINTEKTVIASFENDQINIKSYFGMKYHDGSDKCFVEKENLSIKSISVEPQTIGTFVDNFTGKITKKMLTNTKSQKLTDEEITKVASLFLQIQNKINNVEVKFAIEGNKIYVMNIKNKSDKDKISTEQIIKEISHEGFPEKLKLQLESVQKTGYYSSTQEFLNDAVNTLLFARKDLRKSIAVNLYKEGKIPIGEAIDISGLSYNELQNELNK